MKLTSIFACARYNHRLRAILLVVFMLQLSICVGQSLNLNDFTWEGRTFSKLNSVGSPYDSLVQINGFTWKDDADAQRKFFDQVAKVYMDEFNMERLIEQNRVVCRFIIRNNQGEISILEKAQFPNYMEFYLKNGMAVHEIRFYKLLVPFFRDSYD